MKTELVFNIWFIVDIGTDLSRYAIIKPYYISGSDDEKTKILKVLAESDYVTSERFDFTKNSKILFDDTTIHEHILISSINHFFHFNINLFLKEAEKNLPPIFSFKGDVLGENKVIAQKFPNEPLFVQTILMENEYGEMRPYTRKENMDWALSEKMRIDIKSKGMQN